MADANDITPALEQPTIADTSTLSNFVHAGAADLLRAVLKAPVHISPSVLDPYEATMEPSNWDSLTPTSELLAPFKWTVETTGQEAHDDWNARQAADRTHAVTQRIKTFAQGVGHDWRSIDPTSEELTLAAYLNSHAIREPMRQKCTGARGRIELDAGEAEAVAMAVTRSMTILVDDQAAVNLLRCLYPHVPIVRTCQLLVHAVRIKATTCHQAATLFNDVMVKEHGFYARRSGQQIYLLCDPARCKWQ